MCGYSCFGNINSQLDISVEKTYDVLNDLYQEIADLFPARYIHMGANDINIECWREDNNPQFWEEHGVGQEPNFKADFFFEQTLQMIFEQKKHVVVWEDLLPLTSIPLNVVIQAYKSKNSLYSDAVSNIRHAATAAMILMSP